MPFFLLGHPRRRSGGVVVFLLVLLSPIQPSFALSPPASPAPTQHSPPSDSSSALARGLVFLRLQGPSAGVRHRGLAGSVRLLQAVMLDDPVQTPQPLIIERLEINGHPWLLLTRQLSIRHRYQGARYQSIQALQLLSVVRLSGPVQLIASLPEQPLCRQLDQRDAGIVATRSLSSRDPDSAEFQDLLQAWRVDRRSLRLVPLEPTTIRCRNAAQGVP